VKFRGSYGYPNLYELAVLNKNGGLDYTIVIDGDFNNIHLPIKEQDILLMLPNGNYKCKCSIEKDMITNAYYITLLDKDDNNKDDNDDDNTIQCMGGFYTK